MKSKANIKGHPLHPILVSFPISLFAGALLLDVLSYFSGQQSYRQAALYAEVGGLVSAVVAAVAGIIDYHYTVPPGSSAKKRATKHAITNSCMFLVFVGAFVLRQYTHCDFIVIIVLETVGVGLIAIAAWLGGTLITRNQIGVDHRYAHAGKWREITIRTNEKTIELKNTEALKTDQMCLYRVNGRRIVVARTQSGIVAFDDHCTHRGASLADGVMICGTVQCPWHGSQFDVHNGEVKAGPANEAIRTYEVRASGDQVLLVL